MEPKEGCVRCGAIEFLYSGECRQCYTNPQPLPKKMKPRRPRNPLRPFFRRGTLASYIVAQFRAYTKLRRAILDNMALTQHPRWFV